MNKKDYPPLKTWGVLHFRSIADEGVGWTVYYNYADENVANYGTPLVLGFARCREKSYDKKVGRKLAEDRIQPHHIPLDLKKSIKTKTALLSYIKDYMIGFVIPREAGVAFHSNRSFTNGNIRCQEVPSVFRPTEKGIWYGLIDRPHEMICG